MKPFLALLSCVVLGGCVMTPADISAREWQRAECNKVIDKEDRDRCLKRVGL